MFNCLSGTMQPGGWPVPRSALKSKKHTVAQLSDDELRKRIFGMYCPSTRIMRIAADNFIANTAVLFPSSPSPLIEGNPYEIVYASKAREGEDENPWVSCFYSVLDVEGQELTSVSNML